MQGIPFGFQVMIPDLCRWNLDSEFPSLVVFQTQDSGSLGKTLEDSGFQTQKSAGFRNSLHGARQCHIVLEKLSQFKSFLFLFLCSRGTSLVSYAYACTCACKPSFIRDWMKTARGVAYVHIIRMIVRQDLLWNVRMAYSIIVLSYWKTKYWICLWRLPWRNHFNFMKKSLTVLRVTKKNNRKWTIDGFQALKHWA